VIGDGGWRGWQGRGALKDGDRRLIERGVATGAMHTSGLHNPIEGQRKGDFDRQRRVIAADTIWVTLGAIDALC
jgi:hypothetical protein